MNRLVLYINRRVLISSTNLFRPV